MTQIEIFKQRNMQTEGRKELKSIGGRLEGEGGVERCGGGPGPCFFSLLIVIFLCVIAAVRTMQRDDL